MSEQTTKKHKPSGRRNPHAKGKKPVRADQQEDDRRLKIGVYGGTFNPPHMGHIAAARAAMETMGLDLLYLVPNGMPPHKDLPAGSPTARQRLEMVRLAGWQAGFGERVQVLDIELCRDGRSYTSETLEELKKQHPNDELWFLMGTDMFLSLHHWHEAGKIVESAGIAAFSRTEEDPEDVFATQRARLYTVFPAARIFTLSVPDVVDISSTRLRELLARGQGARLLAPAVYGYILREKLYGTNADLTRLPLSLLRPVALSYLNGRRMSHVLGTEQEAIRLSMLYGGDIEKARRAALLHDCTKRLNQEAQLQLCRRYGIELDKVERSNFKLLHAKTGAAVARELFGVDDEIASAIYYHTTGRADMTLLEKILYLADYIEPSRDFPGVDDIRRASQRSLDEAVRMGLEMSVVDLRRRMLKVHKMTLEALAFMTGGEVKGATVVPPEDKAETAQDAGQTPDETASETENAAASPQEETVSKDAKPGKQKKSAGKAAKKAKTASGDAKTEKDAETASNDAKTEKDATTVKSKKSAKTGKVSKSKKAGKNAEAANAVETAENAAETAEKTVETAENAAAENG